MNKKQIGNIAIGVGAALLLTFLFLQQRPVDAGQHDRFTGDLEVIKELDAEINRDLLKSRYELLGSYDPFVQKLSEMRRVENDLHTPPSFISGREKEEIQQLVNRQSELLSRKRRLLETFKSDNAILKNSLRYFPVVVGELSRKAEQDKDSHVREHLANLLRDILLYDLMPHSDLARKLSDEISHVSSDAGKHWQLNKEFTSAMAHATRIMSTKPKVEDTIGALNALPTANATDQIYVGSVQTGAHDGYSGMPVRINGPQTLVLNYSSLVSGGTVATLTLGIGADDFQFPVFGQPFTATVNGVVNTALTSLLNSLVQTGPVVQFVSIGLNPAIDTPAHTLTLSIDQGGDGGDGWAIDYLTVGVTTNAAAAPEPATAALFLAGIAGLLLRRRLTRS